MTNLLRFEEVKTSGKTRKFNVYSDHSDDYLGKIYWRNGWRRYVMSFDKGCGCVMSFDDKGCDWSIECMAECYKFVAKLMQERKGGR